MLGCVRLSRRIFRLAALIILGAATAATAASPKRVVSINLCTDQLALKLAAPGQLISVSRLAHDPDSSANWRAARGLPVNGSGAEEVFMLRPDLVLAGTFTAASTVDMLRGLGLEVVRFAPAESLADIPDRLARMGAALGREAEAAAAIATFRAQLGELTDAPGKRPRAALYFVNSYTLGDATLAGDILRAAGFDNIAAEAGLTRGGTLPLEQLVMLAPDVIVMGRDYPGQARAEANLAHPALRALQDTTVAATLSDRDWICGTPNVLNAVRVLRDLRLSMQAAQ
jgi:iron complex transport system substrate-binding protein